jgi:RimJ/RimL family protein N-acetyltransferase
VTRVEVVGGPDWPAWRDIRLRALRDSPDAFGSTYAREVAFAEADWRRRLEDPGSVSVLALAGSRPVGMGGGFQDLPGWLHVIAMWVEPAARGQGVAQSVLRGIQRWADDRALRLHLDVSTANPAARRIYERYGFSITGETRPIRAGSDDLVERMVLG